jgi:hypothetical protein
LSPDIKDRHFSEAFQKFWRYFEAKKFLENFAPTDYLLSVLYLLALFQIPVETFVTARLQEVVEKLTAFAVREFSAAVELRATAFTALVPQIISPGFQLDAVLAGCNAAFCAIEPPGNLPLAVHRVVLSRVLEQFDALLVEELLKTPCLLSVSAAAQLRAFATMLHVGAFVEPLTLFPEALSVLMMAPAICGAGGDCDAALRDICPHIPKQVVLYILKNQAIDEFAPLANNTAAFEQRFARELADPDFELVAPVAPKIEDAVRAIDVAHWKEAVLPAEAFTALPFLYNVFAVTH